jgi:hypothetical protein
MLPSTSPASSDNMAAIAPSAAANAPTMPILPDRKPTYSNPRPATLPTPAITR